MHVFKYLELTDDDLLEGLSRDNGCGNYSRGMVFLELVSSAKRRENSFILKCLDIPSCVKIESITKPLEDVEDSDKVAFILKSIRCETAGQLLKEYNADKYMLLERLLIDMYDKVHTGRFYRKDYKSFLPYLKRTVSYIKEFNRNINKNG